MIGDEIMSGEKASEEGWVPVRVGYRKRVIVPIIDEDIQEGDIVLVKIKKAEVKPKD